MTVIPNSQQIPSSIIFLNLSSLFTNYCKTETDKVYLLHYTNNNNVISILDKDEKIIDIQVTAANISINQVTAHDQLFNASKRFINSLVA